MNTRTEVRRVTSPHVPEAPDATWSNCLVVGDEVVISGMTAHPLPRASAPGAPGVPSAYEQAMTALAKIRALLEAAGGGLHNVTKLVVYLTDVADKDEIGRARRDIFGAPYPCSTLVGISGLAFPELKVEIDAFARLDIDLRVAKSN